MTHEIVDGVKFIDVSDRMRQYLRHGPIIRDAGLLDKVVVHHSGASGAKGVQGALNSARFFTNVRGFRTIPYTYWIPEEPSVEGTFEVAVCAPLEWMTYHAVGLNKTGIGVCLQGNKSRKRLTDHQDRCLGTVIPYLQANILNYNNIEGYQPLSWLTMHSEAEKFGGRAKPACPGRHVEEWIEEYKTEALDAIRRGVCYDWL